MQREQFQLLVTRAAEVCARRELIIFGSQSVHPITTTPPVEVLISEECDIWLSEAPELSERLTREMGLHSSFAQSTGVYADAIPPDLPLLPRGWEQRLVSMAIDDITVRCLEIHDLIVSKLSAGRLKHYEFIAAVFMAGLARIDEVARRIQTFADPHTQAVLLARLRISSEATDVRIP